MQITSRDITALLLALLLGTGVLTPPDCPGQDSGDQAMAKPAIVMEENTIFLNNRSGIRIRGSLPIAIRGGRVYRNGRAGINIQQRSVVAVTGCTVFANHNAGINLRNVDRFVLANSAIHQNGTGGLRIRTVASRGRPSLVTVTGSRIFRNHQGGILSWPAGRSPVHLVLRGNRIFHNHKAGVRVENRTMLTAADNLIRENGTAGISSWSEGAATPLLDIHHNTIAFNRGSGINVDSGSTGDGAISNNWIHNNLRAGIACGILGPAGDRRVDVRILNNTIVANGSEVEGAGIRSDASDGVQIENNIIAYNFTTGILTRDCGSYSHNLLFANGETPNCCADQERIPFWIEKVQYGSCSGRGRGGLITDPRFVNPDRYNFFLQPDSPARGAGRDIYGSGTGAVDIGATGGPDGFRPSKDNDQ